ncbi:MAG: glycosyl transferase family 28, partial [Pedobacter sp.]
PSVFITHQLYIKNSLGKLAEQLLQKKNYEYIHRFSRCWIPDMPGEDNLAGSLSHPPTLPTIPCAYTGALTRLNHADKKFIPNHLFISLSGPEPQRTILEEKVMKELFHFEGTAVIARGLPTSNNHIPSTNRFTFYNHLPSTQFNDEIAKAEFVIARTGYSTIMDLVVAGKKSILVPTPGQPEQEFLAAYLMPKNIIWTTSQNSFSLINSIDEARRFPYQFIEAAQPNLLRKAVSEFLSTMKR